LKPTLRASAWHYLYGKFSGQRSNV